MERFFLLLALLSLALILTVLRSLRNERIRVEHSVSWLAAGALLLLLSLAPEMLGAAADWLGLAGAPVEFVEPADGSGRRFIVQQDGIVRVLDRDGRLAPEPFLDLRPAMLPLEQNFEERGLLGFALHPEFRRNGRVFASYSAPLSAGAMPVERRRDAPERRRGSRRARARITDEPRDSA